MMTLHSSAREANVRDSVKKFFLDGLHTSNRPVTFDKTITSPNTSKVSLTKWIIVEFHQLIHRVPYQQNLRVYLCTNKDNEGFRLSQLRDVTMDLLTDSDQEDETRRVVLYQSHATDAWVELTKMMLIIDNESGSLDASSETKYKFIDCHLTWGASI